MSSACSSPAPDPTGSGVVQRKAPPAPKDGRYVGIEGAGPAPQRATQRDWQIFKLMATFGGVLVIVMVAMLNPLGLSWLPAPPERPTMLIYGIIFIPVALFASFMNEFLYTPVEELQEMEQAAAAPPPQPARKVVELSAAAQDLRSRLQDLLDPLQAQRMAGGAAHSYAEVQAARRLVERLGERSILERFLGARSGCPQPAEQMFRDTIRWRAKVVDKMDSDPRSLKAWEENKPYWFGSGMCAREGRLGPSPVAFFRTAFLLPVSKRLTEAQISSAYVCWMEEQMEFQVRAARQRRVSATSDETMPKMVEIYDLQGVGWSHVRCVLALRGLARVLKMGQRYYPENLRRAFVLNAPQVFSVIKRVVAKVLDEKTMQKVVVTTEASHPDLEDYISAKELIELRSTLRQYEPSDSAGMRPLRLDLSR